MCHAALLAVAGQLDCHFCWCFQAVESSKHALGSHSPPYSSQHVPQAQGGTSTSPARPAAETNPGSDAEADLGLNAGANPRPTGADGQHDARANPQPDAEANWAQDISSSANAVSDNLRHSASATNSTGVAVRLADTTTATAVKRELEQQEAPVAKRQKALSKESQAAMAAIAATARLPSTVTKSVH